MSMANSGAHHAVRKGMHTSVLASLELAIAMLTGVASQCPTFAPAHALSVTGHVASTGIHGGTTVVGQEGHPQHGEVGRPQQWWV